MPRNDELVRAANSGDLEKVRQLIEAGADPNSVDEHGMGPLLTYHPEVIQVLLDAGADPTMRDANNDTPLSWASWHQRDKAVIDQLYHEGSGVWGLGVGPDIIPGS